MMLHDDGSSALFHCSWTASVAMQVPVYVQDGFDNEVDLTSLDGTRHSVGDEKPEEFDREEGLSDGVGTADDEAVRQDADRQRSSDPCLSVERVSSLGRGTSAAERSEQGAHVSESGTCKEQDNVLAGQGFPPPSTENHGENLSIQSLQHSAKRKNERDADQQGESAAPVSVPPLLDSSAVEIGMERYLGIAEASMNDRESILQEALRLAVSDRISARMCANFCVVLMDADHSHMRVVKSIDEEVLLECVTCQSNQWHASFHIQGTPGRCGPADRAIQASGGQGTGEFGSSGGQQNSTAGGH
jgi:hypothetical protein